MHEYESIADPDAVSQGDVIEWVTPHRVAPWQVFGVVVTADCDLVRRKYSGVISYVPAMLTSDFIWDAWRPKFFEKLRSSSLQSAANRVNAWRERNLPATQPISESALADWLRRTGTDGMMAELGVTDNGQRMNLNRELSKYVVFDGILALEAPDFDQLRSAFQLAKPGQTEQDADPMAKEIQQSWSSLPGDIFHLPSLPTSDEQGLFLMLRHIRQINDDAVTGRPDVIRSGQAKAKRVARVSAPYRYAITQNLARVFADIGLPQEHTDRCKVAALRFFGTQGSK